LLLDVYAPLPEPTFRQLVRMVTESSLSPALRAKTLERIGRNGDVQRVTVANTPWLLPAGESLRDDIDDRVRFLAPFDPIVWDRRRFTTLWDWEYRLEAYTPPAKRKLGYYALPVLWRDQVVGWANAAVAAGTLRAELRFVRVAPRSPVFRRETEAELARLAECVGANRIERVAQ
jgi:uncharacterized protein YcaQ